MENNYYNSIPKRLRELFPDFESDFEDDYVYPMLYDFILYIFNYINNYKKMQKLVEFIQEAFDSNDFRAKEAIMLQIMESAIENERLTLYLSNHLSGNALECFNKLRKKHE